MPMHPTVFEQTITIPAVDQDGKERPYNHLVIIERCQITPTESYWTAKVHSSSNGLSVAGRTADDSRLLLVKTLRVLADELERIEPLKP